MSRPEKTDAEFEVHFWSCVEKTENCWEWTAGLDGRGYGAIWRRGRKRRAHRIAYELVNGPIEDSLLACHHCDNKKCVNPAHIFVGTHVDNMQDWTKKGKNKLVSDPALLKRGDEHWTRQNTKSAKAELAKISERRKSEWKSGRRVAIRDERGRINGTRMDAS